ncbi:MAG: helix-turn-helix transcriptional regulator [Methanocellales archaeon]|nr:helix-turn-helix transcriptional regulator [Methanocellales archaeon]
MYTPEWLIKFAQDVAGSIVMSPTHGNVIQRYRKKYGMTQKQLSELMNLRRETISRIEGGMVNPTINFIRNFSCILSITEAVRAYRAQDKEIEFPFFDRIAKEFEIPRDKLDQILGIALEEVKI